MGNGVSAMPPLEGGIALRCKDFVIMMSDTKLYQTILTDSTEVEKITALDNNTLLMSLGSRGPLFSRHIRSCLHLHALRTPYSPTQTARLLSQTMQDIRHSNFHGNPLDVHLMLGTADPDHGPRLYRGDPFGFLVEVPYGYIGVSGFITVSILDKYYRPDLTLQEAYSLLRQCVQHMKRRTVLSYPRFRVKVLDRSGQVTELPDLKWAEVEV